MKKHPQPTNSEPVRLLSVIIPAMNEEGCITATVEHLHLELRLNQVEHEIIVVDDGSTDTTWELLTGLTSRIPTLRPVQNLGQHGFGRAVALGIDHMSGDAAVIMMADESDDCRDVVTYWRLLNQGWDAVFGSRFVRGGGVIDYPFHKLILNRLANWFLKFLFRSGVNDTTNAFKAYRKSVLDGCRPFLSPHFNLTVELPLKTIVRGYSWTVTPITWKNRRSGISKLKIKEMGSRYLFIALYCWLERYFSRGDYRKETWGSATPALRGIPPGTPTPRELGWPAGHFYSPLPDLADIREREATIFGPSQPGAPDVPIDPERQLELLDRLAEFYPEQPFGEHRQPGLRYYFDNPNFRHGEALVLYGMIRHLQPKRIIEIGSGYSSCVMLDTNERFFGGSIDCTFIEPYPRQLQELLRSDDRGRIRLLERKVYDVELAEFERLEPGDILFVDSSHVAKVGSDVNDLFFRILPGLRPGVTIHFHDILHNFEYPPKWVYEGRAWNEAYLLRAFLQFNPVFTVEFFNSWLWQFRRDRFAERLPLVQLGPGSSIWLRKGPGGIFSS